MGENSKSSSFSFVCSIISFAVIHINTDRNMTFCLPINKKFNNKLKRIYSFVFIIYKFFIQSLLFIFIFTSGCFFKSESTVISFSISKKLNKSLVKSIVKIYLRIKVINLHNYSPTFVFLFYLVVFFGLLKRLVYYIFQTLLNSNSQFFVRSSFLCALLLKWQLPNLVSE